jgi:CrcB protein
VAEPTAPRVEATDPDIDLHVAGQRAELYRRHGVVLPVIAVGGALGALARYGLGVALPTAPTAFPWTTLLVNVTGCALIGVLMVLVGAVWTGYPLARPFLGTGVLGGYTTFSSYVVDAQRLVDGGRGGLALAYLGGTLVAALSAVWLGGAAARAVLATRRPAALTRDGESGR